MAALVARTIGRARAAGHPGHRGGRGGLRPGARTPSPRTGTRCSRSTCAAPMLCCRAVLPPMMRRSAGAPSSISARWSPSRTLPGSAGVHGVQVRAARLQPGPGRGDAAARGPGGRAVRGRRGHAALGRACPGAPDRARMLTPERRGAGRRAHGRAAANAALEELTLLPAGGVSEPRGMPTCDTDGRRSIRLRGTRTRSKEDRMVTIDRDGREEDLGAAARGRQARVGPADPRGRRWLLGHVLRARLGRAAADDDNVVESQGIKVYIDTHSAPYLAGQRDRLRRQQHDGRRLRDQEPEREVVAAAAASRTSF